MKFLRQHLRFPSCFPCFVQPASNFEELCVAFLPCQDISGFTQRKQALYLRRKWAVSNLTWTIWPWSKQGLRTPHSRTYMSDCVDCSRNGIHAKNIDCSRNGIHAKNNQPVKRLRWRPATWTLRGRRDVGDVDMESRIHRLNLENSGHETLRNPRTSLDLVNKRLVTSSGACSVYKHHDPQVVMCRLDSIRLSRFIS